MTNQQFKDLLESNGIKTREHQFFDFCFGDFGVTTQEYVKDEVCVYTNIISIYFDSVDFQKRVVFFKSKGRTIAIIKRGDIK